MKKILILLIMLFVITGCTVNNVKNMSIDDIINNFIQDKNNLTNTNNKGYRYYLPRGFSVYKNNIYNQTLMSNNDKYYLNIDIVAYYNKTNIEHTNSNFYYYKSFNFNNINGYIDIIEKNDYFFIEMMYNYAIIEVVVKEDNINYAVINMLNILKSIDYNDNVISNEIGENILTQKETKFELEKPETEIDSKNFLEYMEEYGTYESSMPKDTDVIEK